MDLVWVQQCVRFGMGTAMRTIATLFLIISCFPNNKFQNIFGHTNFNVLLSHTITKFLNIISFVEMVTSVCQGAPVSFVWQS